VRSAGVSDPARRHQLLAPSPESRLDYIERLEPGGELGFFHEHHRNAVAHGISQSTHLRDEEIAFLSQRTERNRAAQNAEEFGVDGVGGGRFAHVDVFVSDARFRKRLRQYRASASRINETPEELCCCCCCASTLALCRRSCARICVSWSDANAKSAHG
jgi:hypothetical protein